MHTLSAVDWILLAVLGLSLLLGLWRGLVQEVLSLAGWVAAFYLSQMYARRGHFVGRDRVCRDDAYARD